MTFKEDDLANSIIEHYDGTDRTNEYTESYPEVHYNDYGNRGVVDMFQRTYEVHGDDQFPVHDSLYEIKSAAAIKQSTGANQIIRQFNSMVASFYAGTDWSPAPTVGFELVFTPDEECIQHVADNAPMYVRAHEATPGIDGNDVSARNMVCFRSINMDPPIPVQIVYSISGEAYTIADGESWIEFSKSQNEPLSTTIEDVLDGAYAD